MKRRAILFGVGDYGSESGLGPLKYAATDVQLFGSLLAEEEFGGGKDLVETYVDVGHSIAETALYMFLKDLDRDDVAVIHFSGHGKQDQAGNLWLCFTDTRTEVLEITALGIEQMRSMIHNHRARKVLVTLDCCYSGLGGAQLTRDNVGDKLKSVEEMHSDGSGLYVLSAAGSTETAKEDNSLKAGVFTWHLVNGIRTGEADRDGDGKITVSDLSEYLASEVPKDAARQRPHLSALNAAGAFVVAENRIIKRRTEAETFRIEILRLASDNVMSLKFASEIDDWLLNETNLHRADSRRWNLLEDLRDRRIAFSDFTAKWLVVSREGAPMDLLEHPPSALDQDEQDCTAPNIKKSKDTIDVLLDPDVTKSSSGSSLDIGYQFHRRTPMGVFMSPFVVIGIALHLVSKTADGIPTPLFFLELVYLWTYVGYEFWRYRLGEKAYWAFRAFTVFIAGLIGAYLPSLVLEFFGIAV